MPGFFFNGIHEDGGHVDAGLLVNFLKTGGAGDVDFGDVAADDVQPDEQQTSRSQALADGLKAAGVTQDMSFIVNQVGMFSYSGLSKEQMQRLRSEFGVYGTDSGRLCVAALNSRNIDHVCQAIAAVMK